LVDWLVQRALPTFVPGSLERVQSTHFTDLDLLTPAEAAARSALSELELRYAQEKDRLEAEVGIARAAADPVRYGLLYGTGSVLVDAVAKVMVDAGFEVVDLDEALSGTKSADLLVRYHGDARLVEVKAAAGRPSEDLVRDVERHLATWSQVGAGERVEEGCLVINYEHRLPPRARGNQAYTRPEFVASLKVPVIGTVALFDLWRAGAWDLIRAAVLGDTVQHGAASNTTRASSRPVTHPPKEAEHSEGRRRRLRPLRRSRRS
jgi:hypothetical protein